MTSQTQKMHQTWQDYFERACSKNCNAIIDVISNNMPHATNYDILF